VARGASFAALAARLSLDPSAEHGGLVGTVDLADLRPDIRDALRLLRPGQMSAPVHVPTGFALLQKLRPAEAREAGAVRAAPGAAIAAVGAVKYAAALDGYADVLAAFKQS